MEFCYSGIIGTERCSDYCVNQFLRGRRRRKTYSPSGQLCSEFLVQCTIQVIRLYCSRTGVLCCDFILQCTIQVIRIDCSRTGLLCCDFLLQFITLLYVYPVLERVCCVLILFYNAQYNLYVSSVLERVCCVVILLYNA